MAGAASGKLGYRSSHEVYRRRSIGPERPPSSWDRPGRLYHSGQWPMGRSARRIQ
ncbi:hypothetical protein BDZ91DRAFT_722735 [Kalaharituber pfeilii]|nr:hypothetical protein BDZ91DRAFT_722735 [Kalaharituber pfeilii]